MCLTTIYDEIPLSLRRPTNGFGVFRKREGKLRGGLFKHIPPLEVGVWLNEKDYRLDLSFYNGDDIDNIGYATIISYQTGWHKFPNLEDAVSWANHHCGKDDLLSNEEVFFYKVALRGICVWGNINGRIVVVATEMMIGDRVKV